MKKFWLSVKRNHHRNVNRGVYGYMGWTALKITALYAAAVIPLALLARHFIDFKAVFAYAAAHLPDEAVLPVFFLSESFLGMIPPDLFMIWASSTGSPLAMLTLLGILSYLGGAVSWYIGVWLSERPRIKAYSEKKLQKYVLMVRKWGGAFIIIAALFPFSPLSMVVMAAGLLKYPLRLYLLFGLARIARFVFQGMLYAGIFS